MTGAIYFVTWRLHKKQSELIPEERSEVVAAIRHFDGFRYEIEAYVVMDDHAHVLVNPLESNSVETIVHSWKSFTAHKLQRAFGRRGPIWQDEYYDRIVRDENELIEKVGYILRNPFRRWPDVAEYAWVGFGEGRSGLGDP